MSQAGAAPIDAIVQPGPPQQPDRVRRWYQAAIAVLLVGALIALEILQQQRFIDTVVFSRNETRLSALSTPVSVTLPVGETRRASDYRVYVSFDLTPEDLALNRRRGPR